MSYNQTFTRVLLSCSLVPGLGTSLLVSEVVIITSICAYEHLPHWTKGGGELFNALCICFYLTDVQGCNVVDREVYYYDGNCSLQRVPGDDIVYVTQNK